MWPAIFMLAGTAMQGIGSSYGAYSAIKNSKYAQDIADYHAKYVAAVSRIDAARIDRDRDRVISSQRAAAAASGIAGYDETTLELQYETEILADIDKEILKMNAGIEGLRYQNEGAMQRAQGYSTAAAFGAQGFGSLLSAAGSYGQRSGWFKPETSQLATSQSAPSYPRNFRSF